MLQDKSMLVDLVIRKWTATKHDKAVSSEIEKAHAAHDAGRYNKRLIDKAHTATIETLAGQIRKYHYTRTLPWTDKGQRLLPSALFLEYRQDITSFKAQYLKARDEFLVLYPQLVTAARNRLGSMYDPQDYPSVDELRSQYNIELEIMPVPNAADFRVAVDNEVRDEIREQITNAVQERQAAAVKDCYARMREVVGRISEQCSKEKGKIYDSLMENTEDLVDVLGGLNITGNPTISQLEQDIRGLLTPVDTIRTSPTARKRVADTASDILNRIPWA